MATEYCPVDPPEEPDLPESCEDCVWCFQNIKDENMCCFWYDRKAKQVQRGKKVYRIEEYITTAEEPCEYHETGEWL